MISHTAALRFADAQKRLLRQTYDSAWGQGVGGYQPDADPQQQPDAPRDVAEAGLTGAALLALRRTYSYVAPTSPDPVRRTVALAPAFRGVNAMVGEITSIVPDVSPVEGERALSAAEALQGALRDWAVSNAYRLNMGDSVSWAGEQAGYAEAADADGRLMEWVTEDDDHVCDDCSSLGSMPPMPLAEWPSAPGDGTTECNVGCFSPGTLIQGRVEGGLRASYDGPMVEVYTRVGHRLALTANHPVLTPQGFVPAGDLREGQYVISHRVQVQVPVEGASMPEPQGQQDPALVEDIFESLAERYRSVDVRSRGVDLYGDARFLQGDIEVVVPDRALLDNRPWRATESLGDLVLMSPSTTASYLPSYRRAAKFIFGLRTTSGRVPRCLEEDARPPSRLDVGPCDPTGLALGTERHARSPQLEDRAPDAPSVHMAHRAPRTVRVGVAKRLERRRWWGGMPADRLRRGARLAPNHRGVLLDCLPLQPLRLGAASEIDARLTKPATEDPASDLGLVADALERFPALVAPDEIVQVRHYHFAGHVYDLQSPLGWVSAGGILAANCRCTLDASDVEPTPGDIYVPTLDDSQQATVSSLMDAQAQALGAAMPDVAYLE